MTKDAINTINTLKTQSGAYQIHQLDGLEADPRIHIDRLPFLIRILLESALRHCDGKEVTRQDVLNLALWQPRADFRPAVPFFPGRILLQDFTGVPVIVDLAAMRSAVARLGDDVEKINPTVPVDLVIDHSVQVDFYGIPDALRLNSRKEFERNRERYELLHWAQKAFKNLRIIPPATGIVHQINVEYLTRVVLTREENGILVAYPDSVIGTDSHTTMVNGLGVAGWGEGGIEATAAMLGKPIEMLIPDVIGFRLNGTLPEGATPTDLTLTIVQMLRKKGVVGRFVEFYGSGLSSLPLTDRAMIANMTPENGATMTFFPVDDQTLLYLRQTGRPADLLDLVEKYCKTQHLFRTDTTPDPQYTDLIELDLGTIEPCLAGPKRPQDRVPLRRMKEAFQKALILPKNENGYALKPENLTKSAEVVLSNAPMTLSHGAVAIAAITSCTNTSNPFVMIGAGLVAKKAVEKGLTVKPYVKTNLAPGSRIVTAYLEQAGLLKPLAQLGFDVVGYGCTTCIGNSGPLLAEVADAINNVNLVAAAVLSGNRNFEGRVHPNIQANYLASPPLVVAYALAGTVDFDFDTQPLGSGRDGKPVYLRDIWFTSKEVTELLSRIVQPDLYVNGYANIYSHNHIWNNIHSPDSASYSWQQESTYIQEPPYLKELSLEPSPVRDILGARVLVMLGDSITTDHISPAGSIPASSPAGKYLQEHGVSPDEFNTYGSRRGNDRVMARGTFANIHLKNQLVPGVEGGFTLHFPEKQQMTIFDAAMKYQETSTPLLVLAGKEYGIGSSRDWAAKGVKILGMKAVIAESYERIHRSNLIGMGVLPLQYKTGENARSLGLTGHETFDIENVQENLTPRGKLSIRAHREDGSEFTFHVLIRLDTETEMDIYRHGGILQEILRSMVM